MKKLAIAALALMAGCGVSYHSGTTYTHGGNLPPDPPGVPSSTPDYVIDAGAGANAPYGVYTITTNGQGDWILGWLGDGASHHFTGNVYTPVGSRIAAATFVNANLGDSVNTVADNHIGFDAITDHTVQQSLQISSDVVTNPDQPVTFDLYIDGAPAIDPYTVFPSGGALATTELMPFNLISSNQTFADQADLAPLYNPPKDRDAKAFTLAAPPPRAAHKD